MERRLKERFIGAGVLVLAAVIFIPMLLDDSQKAEMTITETNIPERASDEFTTRLIPVPKPDEIIPVEPGPEEMSVSTGKEDGVATTLPENNQTPRTAAAAPDASSETSPSPGKTDDDKVSEQAGKKSLTGWVVQAGSFSDKENADRLDEKLREAGYRSYIESEKSNNVLSYRVRIGPEILRSEALKLKARLKEEMNQDGIVLSYP